MRIYLAKSEIVGGLIIGEAVAWLLFIIVRLNVPELPIPPQTAEKVSSFSSALTLAVVLPLLALAGLYIAAFLKNFVPVILQAAKFILVGALNTFIDLGVLNALILFTSIATGLPVIAFKAISFLAAVTNSYFWNKYWTFGSKKKAGAGEFAQFFLISTIGILLNAGVFSVLVGLLGTPAGLAPAVWATFSALIATTVSLSWNFLGYKFWVFKTRA